MAEDFENILKNVELFDEQSESEKAKKLNESRCFIGYAKRHPSDKDKFILIVSDIGEPLTTLEFSVSDILHYEILDKDKGEVQIWVGFGASYIQKSFLTVEAEKEYEEEIPGIRPVFRGEGGGFDRAKCETCQCDPECKCGDTRQRAIKDYEGAIPYYTVNKKSSVYHSS